MEFRYLTKAGIIIIMATVCAAGMSCHRGASCVPRSARHWNADRQSGELTDGDGSGPTVQTLLTFEDKWVLAGPVRWNPCDHTISISIGQRPRQGGGFPRVRMECLFDLVTGEWRELIPSLSYFVPPHFTPNGRALVLLLAESSYPIVRYDVASEIHEELYRPPAGWFPGGAKLSPDGDTLAVELYTREPQQHQLCLVPVGEANGTAVVVPLDASENMPISGISWSPDSRLLLCRYYDRGKRRKVFGFITAPSLEISSRVTPGPLYTYTPWGCWAPDSTQIVCFQWNQDQPEIAIDIVAARRGATRRLLSMRDVWLDPTAGCIWSPAGAWIAFVTYEQPGGAARQYSLYLTSATEGTAVRVLGPTVDQLQYLSWAPDGEKLAFIQNNSIKLLELSSAESTE